MSATRMLVLGIIRWSGAAHGYQVRTELLSWGAQEWARINPGSIYHAIRKAAADGLLVEVPRAVPAQRSPADAVAGGRRGLLDEQEARLRAEIAELKSFGTRRQKAAPRTWSSSSGCDWPSSRPISPALANLD